MKRALGLPSLLALGLNGIVGVGIFFAPPVVAKNVPGYAGLLVYAAVVLACLPIALVFARLGARFDEDGGPYLYARAAFGPTAAFGIGWIAYVSALFSTSTVVVGLVEAIAPAIGVVTALGRAIVGGALVTVIAAVLALGLRVSAFTWSAVTVAKLVPLALLLGAAAFASAHAPPAPSSGRGDVLAAALAVLFALQGFEIVPLPAGQVRGGRRVVPLATVGSLALAGMLYLALHAACVAALPNLADRTMPLAEAATVDGGAGLGRLVAAGVTVSSFGIAVGMIAMTPRYLAALGHPDGLGRELATLSARAVPLRSFALTWGAVVVIVAIASRYGSIASLFALSSVSVILQYGVTAAALAALARRRERGLAPRDAWPAPLAIVGAALLCLGAKPIELLLVAAVVASGFALRIVRRGRAAVAPEVRS